MIESQWNGETIGIETGWSCKTKERSIVFLEPIECHQSSRDRTTNARIALSVAAGAQNVFFTI